MPGTQSFQQCRRRLRVEQTRALLDVLDRLGRLLAVKEWRIDGARGHYIDRDAPLADLLSESPCERFYRGLRTGVGRVHASGRTEQRSADVNDPSVVGNALRGFLHGEVQPLSIDSYTAVEFLFGNLHERLLFDVTGVVDDDVEAAKLVHRYIIHFADVGHDAEIALDEHGLNALCPNQTCGFLRLCLCFRAMVMYHDVGSVMGEHNGEGAAKVVSRAVTMATFPVSSLAVVVGAVCTAADRAPAAVKSKAPSPIRACRRGMPPPENSSREGFAPVKSFFAVIGSSSQVGVLLRSVKETIAKCDKVMYP
jgi:hypothetical protein